MVRLKFYDHVEGRSSHTHDFTHTHDVIPVEAGIHLEINPLPQGRRPIYRVQTCTLRMDPGLGRDDIEFEGSPVS